MQPRARRNSLELMDHTFRALVTAAPDAGKANAALFALLSKEWRLPKSAFTLVRGATARAKVVKVAGDPAALADRIGAWVRHHG